jgi:ZIP family zinc transporter
LFACWVRVPPKTIGILAGFAAGALVSAVSFDRVAEAEALPDWEFALWALLGVAVLRGGDWGVERRFGNEGSGGAMGIVVGSVVDGVPESIIFWIQLATGFPVSFSVLGAVVPRPAWIRRSTALDDDRGEGRGVLLPP